MSRLLLTVILSVAFLACKKNDPEAQLEKVVGRWQLLAIEKITDGKSSWESVVAPSPITIRFDGVLLDSTGKSLCCPPRVLIINGQSVTIEIKESLEPILCPMIVCASCTETVDIQVNKSELILSKCGSAKKKFTKQ